LPAAQTGLTPYCQSSRYGATERNSGTPPDSEILPSTLPSARKQD
ncbi:hypothetical protein RCH07_003867, partial [Arthrobacter sp. CG_A4]|nr:hypothetical protein [Arthrobacter sp. CG_A4]